MRRFRDVMDAANYADKHDLLVGYCILEWEQWWYTGTEEELLDLRMTQIQEPYEIFEENGQYGIGA